MEEESTAAAAAAARDDTDAALQEATAASVVVVVDGQAWMMDEPVGPPPGQPVGVAVPLGEKGKPNACRGAPYGNSATTFTTAKHDTNIKDDEADAKQVGLAEELLNLMHHHAADTNNNTTGTTLESYSNDDPPPDKVDGEDDAVTGEESEAKEEEDDGADAFSSEPEANEMTVDDNNNDQPLQSSSAVAAAAPMASSYSTRGRQNNSTIAEQNKKPLEEDPLEAAVGDLLAIAGGQKEQQPLSNKTAAAAASQAAQQPPHPHHHHRDTVLSPPSTTTARMRESFLSDSLTEEERRTRTRYLPDVDGMHALRKPEIKADLALARSTWSSNSAASGGVERLSNNNKSAAATALSSKRAANRVGDDDGGTGASGAMAMDLDHPPGSGNSNTASGDDGALMSEEDRTAASTAVASASAAGTRTICVGSSSMMTMRLPSPAFVVAPPADSTAAAGAAGSYTNKRPKPREVEVVAAFNPPRPPESVGAKKKHRLLRWERRPADMDVDLASYRKTVARTREELKNTNQERDRIVVVDNQLRRHFLQHIVCMNEELQCAEEEITVAQQECVELAGLPSSRTRTRGSMFKGSAAVMNDVVQMLRAKGKDLEAKGLTVAPVSRDTKPSSARGAGGVASVSWKDWDGSTVIKASKLANAWTVPGDRVCTPYGVGTVVAYYSTGSLNKEAPIHPDLLLKSNPTTVAREKADDTMDIDATDMHVSQSDPVPGKKKTIKTVAKPSEGMPGDESLVNVLAPRVAVRMPFGVAFFNLDSVASLEDPSCYTDDEMARRWRGVAETAVAEGSSLDITAMSCVLSSRAVEDDTVARESTADNDNGNAATTLSTAINENKRRILPFGASLLPTANGRGTLLHKANLSDLDEGVTQSFFSGQGVLGLKDNVGVPSGVRKLEDERQDYLNQQAKVLQLRNQLYRQRRIRMLNEKTFAASQERASRVESLVAEMRLDLKSLKGRLDQEIRDLGVSVDQSEHILKSFYMSLDSQHQGEASPPKRLRRLSRMDEEYDKEIEGKAKSLDFDAPESTANTETDEPSSQSRRNGRDAMDVSKQ